MNSNTVEFACVALIALARAAQAQTTSDSNTASYSNSGASSGNASIAGSGNATNTRVSSLRNSGSLQVMSSLRGSGNASVSVHVTISTASSRVSANTSLNGPLATLVTKDAPGLSPYNTACQESVGYSGAQPVKTYPSIQAPGLTTTLSDTAIGSVSFSFSATGFGATAGSALVDRACARRLDAREFRTRELTDPALALRCQSGASRLPVQAAGHRCPGATVALAKAAGRISRLASVSDGLTYCDALVRARQGPPPLDRSTTVQAQEQARASAQLGAQRVPTQSGQAPVVADEAAQAAPASETENVQTMPVESIASKVMRADVKIQQEFDQ
jgi:hypothetical protein